MTGLASILLSLVACGDDPPAAPAIEAPPVASPAPGPALPAAPAPASPGPAVPAGFTVVSEATGDLTGDGSPDHVAVLGRDAGPEPQATLRITLGDAGASPIDAPQAVCAGCGGIKAAPVPFDVVVDPGTHVLSLTSMGGSREVWSRTTKWRYQNSRFELIGIEDTQYDTLAGDVGMLQSITRSVNLSTRKMNEDAETITAITEGSPQTTKVTTPCAVPSDFPVIDLATYVNDTFATPRCTDRNVE